MNNSLAELLVSLPSFTYDQGVIVIDVVMMVVLRVIWWGLEKWEPILPRPRGNVVLSIITALGICFSFCLVASIALTPLYPW